jgi:hypothetical protein
MSGERAGETRDREKTIISDGSYYSSTSPCPTRSSSPRSQQSPIHLSSSQPALSPTPTHCHSSLSTQPSLAQPRPTRQSHPNLTHLDERLVVQVEELVELDTAVGVLLEGTGRLLGGCLLSGGEVGLGGQRGSSGSEAARTRSGGRGDRAK